MTTWSKCLLALIAALPAAALAAPPSDASVHELLTVMESRKLLDQAIGQLDSMMQASAAKALAGQAISAERQKILDDMRAKMIAIFKKEMSWEALEGPVLDVYKKSFTQHEVDGMLAFYKSEPGKAVTAKMPLVLQHTTQLLHERVAALLPKMQQLQRDTIAQLKASD
jgi:hypothetical protein